MQYTDSVFSKAFFRAGGYFVLTQTEVLRCCIHQYHVTWRYRGSLNFMSRDVVTVVLTSTTNFNNTLFYLGCVWRSRHCQSEWLTPMPLPKKPTPTITKSPPFSYVSSLKIVTHVTMVTSRYDPVASKLPPLSLLWLKTVLELFLCMW